ncbi:MAG: VanZ family protein [Bacteroidetes bacterium]|nr:VanZ family protein [Bacteroidota bacterium]MDA1267588.1 VanZ family protein [Bacteroidota bacterium]
MRRGVWFGLWLSTCSVAMLTPGSSLPDVSLISFQDKIIHFILFFVLSYLGMGMGIKEKVEIWRKKLLWINFFLLALLPSIVLETTQHLIPNRSFDLNDLAINLLGVIFGLFGYLYHPSCKFILD